VKSFLQSQGETIVINDDISVTVLKIQGDEVILEIVAPEWLSIEEVPANRTSAKRGAASLPAR
jgi:carbon storage regulator CsrA